MMSEPEKRLQELLDYLLDGSRTDEQEAEFFRLISENQHLTAELVEQLRTHSLLQWQCSEVKTQVDEITPTATCIDVRDSSPRRSIHSTRQPSAKSWTIAVCAMIAAGAAWWQLFGVRQEKTPAIAEIVRSEGVIWSDDTTGLLDQRYVVPGRLTTTAGEFAMKFRAGPEVHVSGAASLMIESDMLVHLDRGQATARVPDSIKGFTIKTPVINVIDQGTEFGVAARAEGITDVIVFEGKVDLEDGISSRGEPKRLTRGEAARVDRRGAIERIMQVGRDQKGGWWTADYPDSEVHVIRQVRDNIPPSDGSQYFCYQITWHGLREDAGAYCDRHPHQWNGLTRNGLPEFLLGADYVKTFNDYRYLNDFEMVIDLSRAANLYIFFDDRVPPPEWLTAQFKDTGGDIGLDEGPWEGIPDHVTAVGGGNSIDNVFSVWRRQCLDTSPVTLGLMGEETQARAMYGIAATPLE